MKKERIIGIEFLRIISMFFIVILHVLGRGGILNNCELFSPNYFLAWLLEILAFCSVNCYGMISGYVGVNSNFKYSNIIKLWFQVLFYTLIITSIFMVFIPEVRLISNVIKAMFPVLFNVYWYFTVYFCMFFFIPYLNKLLNSLNKSESKNLIITIIFFFSIFCLISPEDIFNLASGYSLIWLTLLYLIGGYIRKYGLFDNWTTKRLIIGFLGTLIGTLMIKISTEFLTIKFLGEIKGNLFLIRYNSVTILFEGIFLLLLALRLKFNKTKKVINFIAPLSFSVYLIYTNPLIWDYFMKNRFVDFISYSPIDLLLNILIASFVIYIISIMIDYIRIKIFKALKIDNLSVKITEKLKILKNKIVKYEN